jgi:hypothetical protein
MRLAEVSLSFRRPLHFRFVVLRRDFRELDLRARAAEGEHE